MTPVEICNHALSRLGEARILSLDDGNRVGRLCKLHYGPARDQVLRCHPWSFAKDRATLSAIAQAPAFGWAKQFQLPSNCLRVLTLNGETEEEGEEFAVEAGKLLTDAQSANIRYIFRAEDTSGYDPLAVDAIVVLLAAKMAVDLTSSTSKAEGLRSEYERLTKPLAVTVNAQESKPRKNYMAGVIAASPIIAARFGGQTVPQTEP
ncbi:MAG TPA: hypothetical protein VGE29_08125 [Prosthecobacter sp.]